MLKHFKLLAEAATGNVSADPNTKSPKERGDVSCIPASKAHQSVPLGLPTACRLGTLGSVKLLKLYASTDH